MITSLPKKLVTLGNIRIGHKVPNKSGRGDHPEKLDKFRLTSKNRDILEYAAKHPNFGGELREWKGAPGDGQQWELYTETNRLDVFVPTLMAVSVTYEKWNNGGCALRCDGTNVLWDVDKPRGETYPCVCTNDNMICGAQRVMRLNVQLPDLPGLGVWLFHSSGFYATSELLGTFHQLTAMGVSHSIIEGTLHLEQRTVKREGKSIHFAVPVFWTKFTTRELLHGASASSGALASGERKQITAPVDVSGMFPDEVDERNLRAATGQPEPTPAKAPGEPDADSPLFTRVTALLQSQGMDENKITAYWDRMRRKYHGFTPEVLAILFDQLTSAAEKRAIVITGETINAAAFSQTHDDTPPMVNNEIPEMEAPF
jgi:Recombination directionality factor-like